MNQLDYIQGMGFTAVWISPIVLNTANGYHGFWAQDFYKVNPHFGTEQDLHNFISECHKRDVRTNPLSLSLPDVLCSFG